MTVRRWSATGLRRRWGWVTGAALVSGFLGVPLVWGNAVLPVDVPVLDNVAWLSNDGRGDVVRVNGETGRVDARLGLPDERAGAATVEQGQGIALVELDGVVRAIDVAHLEWNDRAVRAEGEQEVVVGDGAAYLVRGDGLVRPLDPATMTATGEVDVGASLGRGVVARRRLIVPGTDDGRLHVVDAAGQATSSAAGDPGDDVRVVLVGDDVVAVNLSAGRLLRFELSGGALHHLGQVTFEVPEGEVIVPSHLPAGRLWLMAPRSGELLGVDLESGDADSTQVTDPRRDVAGPVVAGGRVYVVDRVDGRLFEVDTDSLEVVHQQDLDVDDASRVDLVAEGETVFVNDPTSSQALVINGDDHQPVDKDQGGEAPAGDQGPPQAPAPPAPPPRPDDRPNGPRGRDDGGRVRAGPSTTVSVVPGNTSTTGSTTTVPTATTITPTTTTTRAPAPPGAVTGLTATAGDGTVSLQWGAAPSPPDRPVTYTITVSPAAPGGTRFGTTALSQTFTGLTNGVTYRFTVTPTNTDGVGQASSTDATPLAPDVPPDITYTLVRETGSGTYEVGFDYTSGSATYTTCSVSMSGGPTLPGTCAGNGTEYVGDFTVTAGECADFAIVVSTSVGEARATESACAPAAPPTTPTSTYCIDPTTGTTFPCTVTPGGG